MPQGSIQGPLSLYSLMIWKVGVGSEVAKFPDDTKFNQDQKGLLGTSERSTQAR